ncbi:hypothetical protein GCM10027048_04490 [Hymenobacter coalescens]
MDVSFTTSGTFDAANSFTIELSNGAGVFPATPNVLATATSTTPQPIQATIPAATASGTGYRLRVVSSNPAVTSAASAAFTVSGVSVAPLATQNILTGANGAPLTATEVGAASARQWAYATTPGGTYTAFSPAATGTTFTPSFAAAGTYYVVVQSTFGCGTITSQEVRFNVTDPVPAPTVVGFTPPNGPVGTVVTITGSDFVAGTTTVRFNGMLATGVTVASASQLTATVPAGATTGTISVSTPNGTGTSTDVYTVDNPAPVITALNPNTRPAGGTAFTLTVNGTGFLASSQINFNGGALTTTFVSMTQLTATVPASALATAGTYDVTVTNPAPGGGTSAAATFTVTVGGGMETFTLLPISGSSYVDGSYVGDNGITWNYVRGRGSVTLNGKAITLEDVASSTVYSAPVPGGLSSLSFSYKRAFSNDVNADVRVNGVSVGTLTTTTSATQTFSVSNLAFAGDVEIRVIQNASGNQVTIDDISWAGYTPTGPEIKVTQAPAATNVNTGATVSVASTAVGASTDVTFTILNEGVLPLTLGTITASNAEFALTGADPSGSSLAANGGTASFTVRFAPAQAGSRTGAISIPSNDATGNENPFVINFSGAATVVYYAKATGDLNDPATFGLNPDGSGAAPADFTTDGQVFTVTGTGRSIAANLTISGTASRLVLAPNAELIIPATFGYTGPLDLGAGSLLTVRNSTLGYTLGAVDASSTIDYAQAGSFTVPIVGGPGYGNLKLTNGTKTLAGGTTTVRGNFTVDNVSNLGGPGSAPFAVLSLLGHYTAQGTVTSAPIANGFTLLLDGNSLQTLTGNGNTLSFYRLIQNNPAGAALATAGGSTNVALGNATTGSNGGGLVLNAGTSLTLNSNTLSIVANGTISGTGQLAGTASASVLISKTGAAEPGTLYVNPAEPLGTLTLNSSGSGDELSLGSSLTVNNLNLTNGILALNGQTLTLNGPVAMAAGTAGQLRGSDTSSLIFTGSGSVSALNFVNTAAASSLASLVLNRSANVTIPLSYSLTVGAATLTRGALQFSGSTRLIVSGTLTGGNADSYVNALTLPTPATATAATLAYPLGGALGFYRPLTLDLTQTSNAAVTNYTARIVDQSANARGVTAPLTNVSAIRYFTLTKETGGASFASGTLTLTFGTDDGVNDQATLRLARSSGASAFADLGTPVVNGTFPSSGFASGTIAASIAALGDFALATDAVTPGVNPLPVVLAAFTARRHADGALLKWTTAQERNSAQFEVLRSTDGGREFRVIGTALAAGNSSSARQYSFVDPALPAGATYYRLRQIDLDGTAVESDIRMVDASAATRVRLYPNPATTTLNVALATPASGYRVLNSLGQPLLQGHGTPSRIDVSALPKGVYLLELHLPNAGRLVQRFVRE